MALVVYSKNPLNLSQREVFTKRGTLASLAPKTNAPFVCFCNGEPILRKDWLREAGDGDIVVYATLLQGGGGGKNPLRLIATIALAAVAGPLAAGLGLGTVGTAFATAGIVFAGTALINAVLPPPKLPSAQQGANLSSPSPTYSLGSQANSARVGSAVPSLYGRHLIYPDLGDQSFIFNSGLKTQNLSQIFVVGIGEYNMFSYKIEDSPIESFKEAEIFPLGPGQANVYGEVYGIYNAVELSGQELVAPVDGELQWIGPFTINPPNQNIEQLHFEMTLSKGLYFANDGGGLDSRTVQWKVEGRRVDEFGDPIVDWFELGSESITAADNATLRVSRFYNVTAGRYQVRAARTNAKDLSIRVGNDINWTNCAGISNAAPTATVATVTRLQVVLQASDNLNSNTARRFNLIAQRKIPTWNPTTGWSGNVETRSIVWAFVDILKSTGVPDARINLQELYELDLFYEARGTFFDGVFDNRISLFEALTLVARAGRAVPIIQGGQITMIRDTLKTMPVAMFSMRNIKRGSFSLKYETATEETANAVRLTYVDGLSYKPKQITVVQPGTAGDVLSSVDLFGVTDEIIATYEARYLVGSNQYRRRSVRFTTEMDGFICRFGDLIVVSHQVPNWGSSGDIVDYDSVTNTLVLSDPVVFGSGDHYIRIQAKNGSVSEEYLCTAGANAYEVVLAETPFPQPYIGSDFERSRFSFGGSSSISKLVKIRSIVPRGTDSVEVSGIIDDPRVYEFAGDDITLVTNQAQALWAADLLELDYEDANSAQRIANAFYADPFGRMGNNDVGYVFEADGA